MCLLVTQDASTPQITSVWLNDFYTYNADGIGVMYAQDGDLIIEKLLPKNVDDLITFYNKHIQGKKCAFHLRMKTHGDIDLLNCHPYEILNMADHGIDMWLMHNGVLHTDNKGDVTKSDTWHYIEYFLRPMLANNPDYAFTDSFEFLIGDHIGASNKFVIMDNLGRTSVINQESGVYWGGRWLSNTYAWSAPLTVSKAPYDDAELAMLEIAKPPVVKKSYKESEWWTKGSNLYDGEDYYNGYNYDYATGKYKTHSAIDHNSFDEEYDIDDELTELELAGFRRAGKMSRRQAGEFVTKFGLDAFYEVCAFVRDKSIDEDWFVRILSDFAYARESFPWLVDEEQVIKRSYVQ